MVHCVRVARATAVKARTEAADALRALLVTTPAELRSSYETCRSAGWPARRRISPGPMATSTAATKLALRLLGQRYQALDAEWPGWMPNWIASPAQAAPRLRQLCGVGPEIAGALLVAARDNPEWLCSEAAFSIAVWRLADPGIVRQDGAAPPEPGRQPSGQHRLVPDRGDAAALASADS
jgi:transposase